MLWYCLWCLQGPLVLMKGKLKVVGYETILDNFSLPTFGNSLEKVHFCFNVIMLQCVTPWRKLLNAHLPLLGFRVHVLVTLCTIAPKLLYDRKECDLAELLTPLATHTLLYSRSPRKTFKKNPPVSSWRCDCVATSTNLKIFIAIISTILL